jgi:hypothetical protein
MKALRQYATPRQLEVLELKISGYSNAEISKKIKLPSREVSRLFARLKIAAARKGYAPDHDMTRTAPDGLYVDGVSTYYGVDGAQSGQWVKMKTDRERQAQILIERLEEGSIHFKRLKRAKAPAAVNDDLLSLITITDYHMGMYAWEAETGDDWDVAISKDVFLNGVADMIDGCPSSGTGILNQLGDFLHFDGLLAMTPASGHLLDADTRYAKIVELSMMVMIEAVQMMLKKFDKVHVINAEGNHDMAGSIWLRKHIKHMFVDEPRVTVDDAEFPYYAYLHGETMLGFHHGHKVKLAQLHKLFAAEPRYRSMWGKATKTYIHTGHMHHERVIEDGGAIAEMHPTLSSRDAYAARGGWVSNRGAKAITYHKTEGEVHRITVRPRLS